MCPDGCVTGGRRHCARVTARLRTLPLDVAARPTL
jgi:hypothetical protein